MLVLSAVNGSGLTISVGCVIGALCIGLVAAFGIAILHTYERFATEQTDKRRTQTHNGIDTPGYRKYLRY